MTAQVDRLEALLARVQQNRQTTRAASPDALASKQVAGAPTAPAVVAHAERTAPAAAPARAPEPRPAKPAAAPTAPARGASTPLEMAVEGRLSAPMGAPSPQQSPKQPAAAAPISYDGRVIVDPQPLAAARPIAQVVSMHPPSQAPTFGELLRRSLSLRPR